MGCAGLHRTNRNKPHSILVHRLMSLGRWCVVWTVLSASLLAVGGVQETPTAVIASSDSVNAAPVSPAQIDELAATAGQDLDLSDQLQAPAQAQAPAPAVATTPEATVTVSAPLQSNLVPISPAVAVTPLKRSLSRTPPISDSPSNTNVKPPTSPSSNSATVNTAPAASKMAAPEARYHAPRSLFEQIEAEHLTLPTAHADQAHLKVTHEVVESEMDPERDEQKDVKPDLSFAAKKRFKQKESCHDDCPGEEHVVEQLKANKPTPPCCVDLLRETTLYVHDLLDSNGIVYWAMKGTLLGVLREQGVIPHDYDIDLGTEMKNLNEIVKLRAKIWSDGYMLFQAPWGKYNNMNLVIIRRTHAVTKYLKRHPPSKDELPRFTNEIRGISIAAEIMAFKPIEDTMVQVLCTATTKKNPNLYTLKTDDSRLKQEYDEDHASYKQRKKSSKDGWLTYATGQDKAWADYNSKFNQHGVSQYCERTAPASFRYEAPVKAVLPPVKMKYFDKEINVPADADAVAKIYFGKDYMTPKRRYGKAPSKKK